MGIKHDDKICGLEYEIALYDIERNLYALCQDVNEAKRVLSQWRDTGSEKKDITIVNYRNPNEIFKDVFGSSSKFTTSQYALEVSDTKKTRSFKPIEVLNEDGVNKTYYLEVRLSVLRDIADLPKAILGVVKNRYDSKASEVYIPEDIRTAVRKAKLR